MKKRENSTSRTPVGHAYQFRAADSCVHRLGAGWKLAMVCALSTAAFAARQPWSLALLLALNIACYFLARLELAALWRDVRFFLYQMAIVIGLFALRFGIPDGLWAGARTALQILLFFLPSAVFLRTTQTSQMMRGLRRIFPERLSFVVFTSLRFLPFFSRELHEIALAQRLRGARLSRKQLMNPRNWKDIFNCLMLPLIVRALKAAREAALSAEARGFGRRPLTPDEEEQARIHTTVRSLQREAVYRNR